MYLHEEGFEDPEGIHPDPVQGPLQFTLFTDGGHIEPADIQPQFAQLPFSVLPVFNGGDLVYPPHELNRLLNPPLRGQGCLHIDEAEFPLESVQPQSSLIGPVHNFVTGHPFGLVIQGVFPTRRKHCQPVLLNGPVEKIVTVSAWILEDRAAGIQKGSEGGDERDESPTPPIFPEKVSTVLDGIEDRLESLFGQSRHEEQVDSFAAQVEGIPHHFFQGSVIIFPSEGVSDRCVVRFGGNFQVEVGDGL